MKYQILCEIARESLCRLHSQRGDNCKRFSTHQVRRRKSAKGVKVVSVARPFFRIRYESMKMNSLGVCWTLVCREQEPTVKDWGSLAHQRVGTDCPIIILSLKFKRRMEGGPRVFLVRPGHLLKTFYEHLDYTFWFHSIMAGPVPVSTAGPPSQFSRSCAGALEAHLAMWA